jgi:hypothetical protein
MHDAKKALARETEGNPVNNVKQLNNEKIREFRTIQRCKVE